jgi:hypothetical protein
VLHSKDNFGEALLKRKSLERGRNATWSGVAAREVSQRENWSRLRWKSCYATMPMPNLGWIGLLYDMKNALDPENSNDELNRLAHDTYYQHCPRSSYRAHVRDTIACILHT